jgi:hypothetical protein
MKYTSHKISWITDILDLTIVFFSNTDSNRIKYICVLFSFFRFSRCPFPYLWHHSSKTSKYVSRHISCMGCLMKENTVLSNRFLHTFLGKTGGSFTSYRNFISFREWSAAKRAKRNKNFYHEWKITRRQTPSDGKSSHCLWQGELKMPLNK